MNIDLKLISRELSVIFSKGNDLEELLQNEPCGVIDFQYEDGFDMDAHVTSYLTTNEIISETLKLRSFHDEYEECQTLPSDLILIANTEGGNYLLFNVVSGNIHFIHHEFPEVLCIADSVSEFKSKLHPADDVGEVESELVFANEEFMALQKAEGNDL